MKKLIISILGISLILGSYGVMASSSCCSSSEEKSSAENSKTAENTTLTAATYSDVEYKRYDLSAIEEDIRANSLRADNYIGKGMIITGIVSYISNDSVTIKSENGRVNMKVYAAVGSISSSVILDLSLGDKVDVRGVCTSASYSSIHLDASDITIIQSSEELEQELFDQVCQAAEERGLITMEELYDIARANPLNLDSYENQYIMIEGTLEHIDSSIKRFTLGDEGGKCDLECSLRNDDVLDQLSSFTIGQRIVVTGQGSFNYNANNNIDSDNFAVQFMEGFTDGLFGISADGFNMYFTVYRIELAE